MDQGQRTGTPEEQEPGDNEDGQWWSDLAALVNALGKGKAASKGKGKDQHRPFCTVCRREGHTAEQCWYKVKGVGKGKAGYGKGSGQGGGKDQVRTKERAKARTASSFSAEHAGGTGITHGNVLVPKERRKVDRSMKWKKEVKKVKNRRSPTMRKGSPLKRSWLRRYLQFQKSWMNGK